MHNWSIQERAFWNGAFWQWLVPPTWNQRTIEFKRLSIDLARLILWKQLNSYSFWYTPNMDIIARYILLSSLQLYWYKRIFLHLLNLLLFCCWMLVGGVLYFFSLYINCFLCEFSFSCCTCIINCTLYGFIYLYFDNDQVRHKYHLFAGNLYLWRVTIPFFICRRISKKTRKSSKKWKKHLWRWFICWQLFLCC